MIWFGLVLWHINHCKLFNAKSIVIHINSSISNNSVFHTNMQLSSIWTIDRTLSDATTQGQSGPVNNGNKGVLHINQSSSITGASPSCLMSYPGHALVVSYPSAEMQSVYSFVNSIGRNIFKQAWAHSFVHV